MAGDIFFSSSQHPVKLIFWHADPSLGNDNYMSRHTTAIARQWSSSDHMGIPTNVNATMNTTDEQCFLCSQCQDVIRKTTGAMNKL
jgi:hypothetical protein